MFPALLLSLSALATPALKASDPLADLAAEIEASTSLQERVDLARMARRNDRGGSLWWFEVEARARQAAFDHAAAVRVLTEALENPLVDADRAVLHELRAESLGWLNDPERRLADLIQAARLDPSRPELEARMHAALAERLERRRIEREVEESQALLARFPEDHATQLRWAHALIEDEQLEEGYLQIEVLMGEAPELLSLADLLGCAAYQERNGWPGAAVRPLEIAVERFGGEGLEQRLEELRALAEDDMGSLGYVGYLGYDEGNDEGTGAGADPTPLAVLSDAELRGAIAEWKAAIARLDEGTEDYFDAYFAGDAVLRELRDELAACATPEEVEGLAARADELAASQDAWAALHAAVQADVARLEAGLRSWASWAYELAEDDPRRDVADEVIAAWEAYTGLSSFEVVDPLKALSGLVDARLAELAAAEARDQAIAGLIRGRSELAPEVAMGRAEALLASGPATPDLLAALGLARLDLNDRSRALAPLHLSLAAAGDGSMTLKAEVREGLLNLAEEAAPLAAAARRALNAGQAAQAVSLAARAVDLAPTRADLYDLEATCLAAGGERSKRLEALAARRLATYLQPFDHVSSEVLHAHVSLARDLRALSEAREVADLLVACSPRDPGALLLRAPLLAMQGLVEEAAADRKFAYELGGRERLALREPWESSLEGRTPFRRMQHLTWEADDAAEVGNRLPWYPDGLRGGAATAAISELVLEALRGERSVESLLTAPEALSETARRQWPGVACYLAGEVVRAVGDEGWYEASKPWYRRSIKDPETPTSVACLASERLNEPLLIARPDSIRPLMVPRDVAKLNDALAIARRGQTIVLAPGNYTLSTDLTRSVRLVGAGAGRTTLRISAPWANNPARDLFVAPELAYGTRMPKGINATGGWVELEDLTLETWVREEGLNEGERRRHVARSGGLSLTRCELAGATSLAVEPGASLALFDTDLTGAEREAVVATGGSLVLDRVVLSQPLELSGTAHLRGERVTLVGAGALAAAGAGAHLDIGGLTVIDGPDSTEPALRLAGGAKGEVDAVLWRSVAGLSLLSPKDSGDLRIGAVDQVGGEPAPAAAAVETWDPAPGARALEPVLVSTTGELLAALTDPAAPDLHLLLEPGLYLLPGVDIFGDTVLVGKTEGVQLQVASNAADHILRVHPGADLVLENLELGVRTWREAEPGSALAEAGSGYLLDRSFDVYDLLQVEGRVLLDGVSQLVQSGADLAAGEVLADVRAGGRLLSIGLAEGRGMTVLGRAQLVDGGVDVLVVRDEGRAELSGRGHLERLEVVGEGAVAQLDDLRPGHLEFAAFRRGAADPRSDLRRRHDGVDPVVYQAQLLAAARERWLTDVHGTAADRGEALVSYALAHVRAMAYTQPNEDRRADSAAEVLRPFLRGDVELIHAVVDETYAAGAPYSLTRALYRDMDPDDYRRFIAENRARYELGEDATAVEVANYATWEEAVLADELDRDQMAYGLARGLSVAGYYEELRRQAREAAEREREAEEALASGDRVRIREALQAISTGRWLEYVRYDDLATLEEVEDALAAAAWSEHEYWLMNKRDQLAAALAPTPVYTSGGGYESGYGGYGGGSSSGYSPGFDSWLTEMNTWNRDMDIAIEAIASSSYDSYRNQYDY